MLRQATFLLFTLHLVSASAQSGPAYYWLLDETSGTMAQAFSGGSPGVLQGGVLWDPIGGHHQGAARFDGVDDRILLGPCDLTNGGAQITLSLWVRPDFVTGMERTLIAKATGPTAEDHQWSIAFVNATALRFRLRTGGTTTELNTSPSSIFSGTWYHVAAVYDGAQMWLYINGGLMASTSKSGSLNFAPQAPASLGAQSTGSAPFSGWIDDVRIYDRALTGTEVIGILFEQITTGIADAPHALSYRDGMLHVPAGHWTTVTIIDPSGRTVMERPVAYTLTNTEVGTLPTGIYLVCLLGPEQRSVHRMLLP